MATGGRFDFDDGGSYCGGWAEGKAHGFGVCTGPNGQGHYDGAWHYGFEVSGTYTWPSGNDYQGQWNLGKRHGLGVEHKGRWVYRGDWTHGFKGRYGVRQSTTSGAKYEGTWSTGLQDGYGVETYADGGTYRGQWLRGMRHGYGVRQSVPYNLAVHYRPKGLDSSKSSVHTDHEDDPKVKSRDLKVDQGRGGFVLKAKSSHEATGHHHRRKSLFDGQGGTSLRRAIVKTLKRDRVPRSSSVDSPPERRSSSGGPTPSTRPMGSVRSTDSRESVQSGMTETTDSNASFVSQDDVLLDATVVETYAGEWKNDKRCGYGVSERSDGLKYEGEWFNNKKNGYGVTTLQDGRKEEGKYKDNELTSSGKKPRLFVVKSNKMRERIDLTVSEAAKASEIAIQKTGIAISRMASAKCRAEMADRTAERARADADIAQSTAKEFQHIPLVIDVGSGASSKHDSQETGSDASKGPEVFDDRKSSMKEKRGSKSLIINAFTSALKRRQSAEISSVFSDAKTGSSPRKSVVSSSPEDLEDRRFDEMNRRNRRDSSMGRKNERISTNSKSPDGANCESSAGEDDFIRRTHILAQRLNRPSIDLGASPKRTRNSVSWSNPESVESPSKSLSTYSTLRTPPTDGVDDRSTAEVRSQGGNAAVHVGNLSPSSVRDVTERSRDFVLSPIDEDDTRAEPGSFLAPPSGDARQTHQNILRNRPLTQQHRVGNVQDSKNRRLTLPSLVKVTDPVLLQDAEDAPANPSISKAVTDGGSSRPSLRSNDHQKQTTPEGKTTSPSDTYAIINGVRTLVRPQNGLGLSSAEPHPASRQRTPDPGTSPVKEISSDPEDSPCLPKRYVLEPVPGRTGSSKNRGSLPELFDLKGFAGRGLSREEAHLLSERRREQLRREREERERRSRMDIVLSFGHLKDWWRERQLMMVVIAINIGLAAVFFNLLSR